MPRPIEDYGFIITRHVRDELTNKYWNRAILCIRNFYPNKKIVVIDDNSNKQFVKPLVNLKNVIIIKSEFPGAGEILPYYYFLKYQFFPFACILHDSVFIHKKIKFSTILHKYEAMSLWHFDGDQLMSEIRDPLTLKLENGMNLVRTMRSDMAISLFNKWHGSFGGQTLMSLNFLQRLQEKYKLMNLVNFIKCRADRMAFERIIGVLLSKETNYNRKSLFGNIHRYQTFGYDYQHYIRDFYQGKIPRNIVKVWTGR